VFGALGEARDDRPAEIRIGDSVVMVSPADTRASFPAFLYVICNAVNFDRIAK